MTEAEKPMLGPSNRLAEYAPEPNLETKKKDVVWFAIDDNRPLTCFAVLSSRAIVTQNRSLLVEQGRRAQAEAVRAVIAADAIIAAHNRSVQRNRVAPEVAQPEVSVSLGIMEHNG